jgi:hypothetical protein
MSVTKPVFTDDTGRRATVLLWLGRVVVTVSVILGAAMAFTLTTHIALPGLDGLVSPSLNGSQPEVGIPATPDPVEATEVPTAVFELTATPRARSEQSSSLRTTSPAVATRRSSTTTRRSTSTTTSTARSSAKPRNSHAAAPSTPGRKAGKTTDPEPPGQTRKPVR